VGPQLIMAKTTVFAGVRVLVECRLTAGAEFDISRATVGIATGASYIDTIPNLLMHTFASQGSITLTCRLLSPPPDTGAAIFNMKLAAIKLDAESHAAAP
jgi:hypothetical protein